MTSVDAVVVGSGPNGMTAAVTLARAGLSVRVYEAAERIGGGASTEELTLPGFRHDPCSAVHPLGVGSPVFAALPLEKFGLDWLHPATQLAHPRDDGPPLALLRDLDETAGILGADGPRYRRLLAPFVPRWNELAIDALRAPLLAPPRHPVLLANFGARAGWPLAALRRMFTGEGTAAMLAGIAAHVMAPLTSLGTGGVALIFALAAHANGWPIPRGGSQAITDALAGYFTELGGTISTGHRVRTLAELPQARAYLLDTSPSALAELAGDRLPWNYRRRLGRYRYGPAVYKIDYALSEPVPWRDETCRTAGTVHIGPSYREIGAALRSTVDGRAPDPPFLITAQPSVIDDSRAPAGKHVFWAYAHVPHGYDGDLTEAVENQIERFAPGFRDVVLARSVRTPAQAQAANANYVGGDIACGSFTGVQTLFRPMLRRVPYATPAEDVFLCSAATPPGPGVHGICGHYAASVALRRRFGINPDPLR